MSKLTERLRDPRNQFLFDPDVSDKAWELVNTAADRIEALEKRLQEFITAFDAGAVEIASPEIDISDSDIPPHPWHEEWLYHARALLEKQ